jgi:putative oxidoreductase
MNAIQKIESYGDTHYPVIWAGLRIILGAIILFKGIIFIQDTGALMQMMENSRFPWASFGLAHYVAFAHLVGGFLILMGLKTRIAIAFQLPVLLGAVFFVNAPRGFFSGNTELFFSLLVLILLLVFLVYGSGRYSLDHYMRSQHYRDRNI